MNKWQRGREAARIRRRMLLNRIRKRLRREKSDLPNRLRTEKAVVAECPLRWLLFFLEVEKRLVVSEKNGFRK